MEISISQLSGARDVKCHVKTNEMEIETNNEEKYSNYLNIT